MSISKYTKKAVEVEAGQLTADNVYTLAEWCQGSTDGVNVDIVTLEGTMTAIPGDYIIKGVEGEFYPCKPHIFEKTYEV